MEHKKKSIINVYIVIVVWYAELTTMANPSSKTQKTKYLSPLLVAAIAVLSFVAAFFGTWFIILSPWFFTEPNPASGAGLMVFFFSPTPYILFVVGMILWFMLCRKFLEKQGWAFPGTSLGLALAAILIPFLLLYVSLILKITIVGNFVETIGYAWPIINLIFMYFTLTQTHKIPRISTT